MAGPLYRERPKPPGIYRWARALRRLSVVVLLVLVLYVGIAAYSAVQVVKTAPRVGDPSVALESNDTIGITTSFTLTNPSLFPIQQFGLHFRILNGTGLPLFSSTVQTGTVAAGASDVLPIGLYVPLTTAGTSLLTQDQYLQWNVWGNATYAYLFPVSIGVETERSWGAPFDNLTAALGAPRMNNGTEEIPVTLTFSNDASFADAGALDFQVVPVSGANCAEGSFAMNVPPGAPYSNTEVVSLASGCSPAGGHVNAQFVGSGYTVPFPPEAIP